MKPKLKPQPVAKLRLVHGKKFLTRGGETAEVMALSEEPDESGAIGVASTRACSFCINPDGSAHGDDRSLDLVAELPAVTLN